MDLSAREFGAVVAIGDLCGSARPSAALADDVLDQLATVLPYDAAAFSIFDPVARRHLTLTNRAYPAHVLGHLEHDYQRSQAYRRIYARRWPDRINDTPFDFRETEAFVDFLGASGFDEGMTTCLFARDGRYVGMLNVSACGTAAISDTARQIVGSMLATFSRVVDIARAPAWLPVLLESCTAAIGVLRDGSTIALPGCDPGAVLPGETRLHRLAASYEPGVGTAPPRFLWRVPAGWRRIQLMRVGTLPGGPLDVSVVAEEALDGLPHGLTAREIDVLTLVAAGSSNREIADRLVVTARTVATHVEHLLAKLEHTSRAGLTATALHEGLIHPSPREVALAPADER